MRYWLLKSEPDDISIDDIAAEPARSFAWTGIRNYQARNFLREMQVGDLAFFYHSSCAEIGIAGVVEIVGATYPDPTQFDETSRYFDPKATPENPRWLSVEIRYVKKTRLLPLGELKSHPELEGMKLLAKGSRLSVSPVEASEWRFIEGLFKA